MTNYADTDGQVNVATQQSRLAAANARGHERPVAQIRAFFVRRRTFMGLLAAFALVAIAQPHPGLLYAGLGLMALAHALRVLCTGYLDKDEKLVTCGPFGWCRNPLYIANLMVVVAFTLMSGRLIVLPVMLLMWVLTHAPTVAAEEDFLRERFAGEFDSYCRQVPRWWPRRPTGANGGHFSWRRVIINGEHLNILSAWIVAAMFFVEMVR